MTENKQEPSDENFKKFVKFYDELEKAKKVLGSVNFDPSNPENDPRSWVENSSRKKLAEIVFPVAGSEVESVDALVRDPQALATAYNAYRNFTSNEYSKYLKAGENLETTVSGIKPKTLDTLIGLERENPLIARNLSQKEFDVYQAYTALEQFNDLESRAKRGKNALTEEERETLKRSVVEAHVKDRIAAIKKKYEKNPQSEGFYKSMTALAQISISGKDFGSKEFDSKVASAIKLMKEPHQKEYDSKVQKNEGNDIYEVFRNGIKKLATSDSEQYKAIAQRLYVVGKSSK